jgi:tetratricopeptide (TPR) repeat protein
MQFTEDTTRRCSINCTELFTSCFSSKGTKTSNHSPNGVSIYYLKNNFANEVLSYSDSKTLSKSIYDLEDTRQEKNGFIRSKGENITCPRDGKVGAAFVDCLHGEDNVGVANVMLSYSWGNTVDEIIDVLDLFALKRGLDPKKTYVWICCLCNNQHRVFERSKKNEVVPFEDFQAIFKAQVMGVDSIVALMSPWQKSLYLTRIWCIFELHTAHENGCDINIEMPRKEREELKRAVLSDPDSFEDIFAVLASTKIEEANASVDMDRVNILGIVEAGGGTASLNIAVNNCIREWIFGNLKDFVKEELDDNVKEDNYGGKDVRDLDDGYDNIGCIFYHHDELEAAMDCYKKQRELCEGCYGKTHICTAKAYNNIGLVHLKLKEFDEAIEWMKKATSIAEKVHGLTHENTAASYFNISDVYIEKEDWDEALKYLEKSCKIYKDTHRKDHIESAKVYNDIGLVHKKKGDYDKALQFFGDSLKIQKEKYPNKDHPHIALSYNNIGAVHGAKGDIDKELEYYLLAVDIEEKVLGVGHSSTLRSYTNISDAYEEKGDTENAMKFSKKANQE